VTVPQFADTLTVQASVTGRRWELRPHDAETVRHLRQRFQFPEVAARLLAARGVSAADAEDFLAPTLRRWLPEPNLLKDMEGGAARLVRAITGGERVAILADYDVEGATGAALLTRFLLSAGLAPRLYVPDRLTEGYGPSPGAIETLHGVLLGVMKDAAALIKSNIGVKVIAISIGGWDHHTNLLLNLAALGGELAAGLKAFHDDLGTELGRTLTLAMTEFGRRVEENGGDGTDHGHGGVIMALGGGIAGGRVLVRDGTWPGLAPAQRYIGQDMQVTTDFRDVFAEALNRHMGLATSGMGPIFPGFSANAARFPGLYV